MNGVFVNNKQRKHSPLSYDDTLELGDVAFRFKLQTSRVLANDATAELGESPTEFDFDFVLDDGDDEEQIA